MADIRDYGLFIRSRWEWERFGYTIGWPRGCTFTDIDALVEFNGRRLLVETKMWDGTSKYPPIVPTGQLIALRREARDEGRTVLIVYGCACCAVPHAFERLHADGKRDGHDLRTLDIAARRLALKQAMDAAMGLIGK